MEDINPNILKVAAFLLRKRAFEFISLEDDSELRCIFESFGGIGDGIKFFKLVNGRVEAWTHIFTTIVIF